MFLKIMGPEDLPDGDPSKGYQLFDKVESAEFRKDGDKAFVDVLFEDAEGDSETWAVSTNCYLLNADGKTVSHFGPNSKSKRPTPRPPCGR